MQSGHPNRQAAYKLDGMMEERFTTFRFFSPLPMHERVPDFPHCGRCTAAFILQNGKQRPGGDVAPGADRHIDVAPDAVSSTAASLNNLVQMHRDGHLDAEEFRAAKRRMLHMH